MRKPEDELAALESRQLRRELRTIHSPQGATVNLEEGEFLNFSSNDYLGLSADERLKEALIEGVTAYGTGSGASRLICGTQSPHLELEEALAAFKATGASLTFSSGYATSVGTLSALVGKDDVIILDKLCHASLIDGARLSGASLRVFPHNHLGKLERHLEWAASRVDAKNGRILVVTESVFSMDGDRAPLIEIVDLKDKYGAWLLLDEAHAFGVMGEGGRGLGAELGIEPGRIELQMGTLSKAAGLSGGYLCGRRATIDLLINRARSFIYSTAPTAAVAVAAQRALELISGKEGDALRERLWQNVGQVADAVGQAAESAIVPVILGENEAALDAAEKMKEAGFLIPAIRYPTVPRGEARLRITLSAAHSPQQVRSLIEFAGSAGIFGS